ncbi:sensor histidine kinase [Tritonibacter horizontis]|uniref:histidine kinase n=1 Tax=Tritonibacter horizontis TaxID=1768241 RepID=A0A132C2W5_9RHOB|nr:ATP-binding protein [Tritonibacter horizontis]KUP95005.1 phytochrome-like protein cph1 [Tritonibacter horizontis]
MRPEVIKTIVLCGALPVMASLSLDMTWPDWRWMNYPTHAALEALGTVSAFAIAAFILILLRYGELQRPYVWIAAGLAGMGVLDGIHSLLHVGQPFVWTQNLASLFGGLMFAAVWLPERYTPDRQATALVLGSAVCAAVIGLIMPEPATPLPANLSEGFFAALPAVLSVVGGIGFLSASAYFLLTPTDSGDAARAVFSTYAFLFGVASILFEISTLWGATWWLWHGLRALAYLVAFRYFFGIFNAQMQSLKSTEDRLQDALANIFENTSEGILIIDHAGFVGNANAAAQTMFQHDLESFSSQTLADVLPDIAGLDPTQWAEAPTIDGLRHDGTAFQAEASLNPLHAGGPYSHFIIVRDISERKRAEQQVFNLVDKLQASKIELERSNAELDTFAYVASHDLRSPLRTIQNAVQWLEEDLTEHFTQDTRDTMDIILRRTRRMEQLLEDLLLHSRIGRNPSSSALIAGPDLIRLVQDLVPQKDGFRIFADSTFDEILVEKTPLLQILLGLVGNAIKHHDGTSGSVFLSVSETEDAHVFTVTDDGPGIPSRYHDRIFEMFTTLQPRDKVEGSGMGLAIVQKYVDVVGGAISVYSEGRGCRFTLTWPNAQTSRQELDRSA